MFSNLIRKICVMASVATLALASNANATNIEISPGQVGFFFGDNNGVTDSGGYSANSFYAFFGNQYQNDPRFVSYTLNLNEAAGTASVIISGLQGSIFSGANRDAYRGDAAALADVSLDIAFTWTGLTRDADGNLVGRTPTGGGAVASLRSDYFDNGQVQFALSPKAAGTSAYSQWVWGSLVDSPLYFFLGAQPDNWQHPFADSAFNAWVMANGPVNINGLSYSVQGDFSGHANVPEPATMLLLGSGVIGGAIRRRKKA